ncbi:MAG TPA: molybdopterin cofactor-binding domain-containing protein, partial [Acidimicrobiia bacterium]|nr:molybdopterin cofactor-binding domain-containing protein [Acidimicrobiia bacterium]
MSAPPVHAPTAGRFVGQSVLRREDARLLTGQGSFLDDVVVPGMLHAAFVRSDLAHARITRIDVEAARALDGVHAVLTSADLDPGAGSLQPSMFQSPESGPCAPLRLLAGDDVRFVGDAVALVIAESRYLAEDACELVEVEYEPLPAVVDPEVAASDDAHLVHPELGSNVAMDIGTQTDPELEQVFETAAHVVSERIVQHRHMTVPMETRGVVAGYSPSTGDLDVWIATQNPHENRATLARLTGVPESRIHVRMGDVGGGFGLRYFLQREEGAVVMAAYRLGRTIKWVEDRREQLVAASHARVDVATVKLALDGDGRILGAHLDHVEDAGSYPVGGTGGTGAFTAMLFPGPYRIPKFGWRCRVVWTNTSGRGAYRGPWMFESVAREEIMDLAARAAGIDPLELRRRNVVHSSELPYQTVTGMPLDRVTPEETLEQAAAI